MTKRALLFLAPFAVSLSSCQCGRVVDEDAGAEPDGAAAVDAGRVDAGRVDAGAADRARADGGGSDARVADAAIVDPAPDVDTPGEHSCAGCPESDVSTFTISEEGSTYTFCGTVTGAEDEGSFYVVFVPDPNEPAQELSGAVPLDGTTGQFCVTLPLFCGQQTVKIVFANSSGQLVLVYDVTRSSCEPVDIQITLVWDAIGDDWELHLIRPGGQINDQTNLTDCTWTTCIYSSPDWGVQGDSSDDPRKDVDDVGDYGPENIYLSGPEEGQYVVMVEHWGTGSPESDGMVIFNVSGKTLVVRHDDLVPQWVWTAGTIDWPAGLVTPSQQVYDCSEDWSGGCIADIP